MGNAALITAGGKGLRMGYQKPKQYIPLKGVPIITRSILAFDNIDHVERLILTVPKGDEALCQDKFVGPWSVKKPVTIVPGGNTRQESVWKGLQEIGPSELVTIHDAARPMVSERVIKETFRIAQLSSAAIAAVKVQDTVKSENQGRLQTIPRQGLWLAHTPQTFQSQLILEAHELAIKNSFQGTDDSSLVEELGIKVALVEDDVVNIKITTPEDLWLAERFLSKKR